MNVAKRDFYRYLVMPKHLNPMGKLFGGQLISWFDESVFMSIKNFTDSNCVTASIKEFNFLKPARLNDEVRVETNIVKQNNSSIEVEVLAFVDRKKKIAESRFVMVVIDENGNPIKNRQYSSSFESIKEASEANSFVHSLNKL